MKGVAQTLFEHGNGNALQACVASLLELPLESVPNFIEAPGGYLGAVQEFLAPRGLCLIKVPLTPEGKLPLTMGTAAAFCLLTGKSPRGGHSHAVVGRVNPESGDTVTCAHDPHPNGGGIDGAGNWVGFLSSLCSGSAAPPSTAAATVGDGSAPSRPGMRSGPALSGGHFMAASMQAAMASTTAATATATTPAEGASPPDAPFAGAAEAACGQCLWGMELPGSEHGCDLAVRVSGGRTGFVVGSGLDDHGDAHAEDGLCCKVRSASIVGVFRQDGRFVASEFVVQ